MSISQVDQHTTNAIKLARKWDICYVVPQMSTEILKYFTKYYNYKFIKVWVDHGFPYAKLDRLVAVSRFVM